jgi:hypothetical protein
LFFLFLFAPVAQSSTLPRAYVIEGLWSDHFQIVPALHQAGLPSTRLTVNELSATDPDLNQFAVVVLANVDVLQLKEPRLARLKDFVANGGGLVVLGGSCAFSRGGYTNTPLEEMLPVTFPVTHLMPRYLDGLPLTRASAATWLPAFDESAKPAAFYVQTLPPKPGATVELLAGNQPAIITGTFGKGRVVAVALTVHGEAPAGVTAFWDWPGWPQLLGQVIDWAGNNRLPIPPSTANQPPPLTPDEINDFALGLKIPKDLLPRAQAHPSAEVAQALFTHITTPDSDTKLTLAAALPVLRPYAQPDWGKRLLDRAAAFNPNRDDRQAAVVLLGASRMTDAVPRLLSALQEPETRLAALEALGLTGDPAALPALRDQFAKLMRDAQLPDDPDWLRPEEFARDLALPAAEAALALYRLGDADAVPRLLQLHRQVNLYRRIYRTVARTQYRNWNATTQAQQKLHQECADRLAAAQQRLQNATPPIPANQLAAFLTRAQTATEPVDVEWFLANLEKSLPAYPPVTWQPLTNAADAILARFARTAGR